MLPLFDRDFILKLVLKKLGYKTAIYLLLIVVLLNLTQILSKVAKLFRKKIQLNLSSDDKRYSNMYWIPKLHKNPTVSIFFVAAPECSAKLFSNIHLEIIILSNQSL